MKIAALIITIFSLNFTAFADNPSGEMARRQLLETGHCPGCDLRGIDLSNEKLIGANLAGADLSGAQLENTNLRGANLQGATLLKLDLSETRLAGANLKHANLSDQDIDVTFEYVEIIGTQLEGARFKYGVVCGALPDKGGWGCQHL
jgi:uncharacterized protein YjbI with pentapeptide repeats